MKKVSVEFINTCPCCNSVGDMIEEVASKYGDSVEFKLYMTGKDVDYIQKYGMIYTGTMIINGTERFQNLSKKIVEDEIKKAVDSSM